MNLQEFIRAVERELGRKLRTEETAFVERTWEIRRGAMNDSDVPVVVNDLRRGNIRSDKDEEEEDSGRVVPQAADTLRPTRRDDPSEYTPGGALTQEAYEAGAAIGLTQAEVDNALAEAREQATFARQYAASGQILPPGVSTDPTGAMRTLVDGWKQEAIEARGPGIGVPEGFMAQVELRGPRTVMGRSVPDEVFGSGFRDVEPRYFSGDQLSPAGLSTEKILSIQQRLYKAGLLEEGDYYPGFWDSNTTAAYEAALGWSNQRGTAVDDTLDFLASNLPDSVKERRNRAELAKQFQAPAYVKPDYATLAQSTKDYMRAKLGRKPTDEEMKELTAAMSSSYRADYEAEVARLRSEWNAQQAGLETGTAQTPGAVTDVDPTSRFRQVFDERFGAEMDFIEGQEETALNTRNVMSSISSMSRLVGRR